MDVLSDYTSMIVEFKLTQPTAKVGTLVDNCTGTETPPPQKNISVATNPKQDAGTQTKFHCTLEQQQMVTYDERELANWLRRIYPLIAIELEAGTTPMMDNYMAESETSLLESLQVQTYQKLSMGSMEHSQGLATWLSVHTNNAPVLVVTTVAPHDDWCEHLNQNLKFYVPKRMPQSNFVVFTEFKCLPLKSCLKCLSTNPFNKNIFAGASMDGDICVWQYVHAANESSNRVRELYCAASTQSAAVALDWPAEQRLLACYPNGLLQQWQLGKQLVLEWSYSLRPPATGVIELSSMLSLRLNDIIVGTKAGGVYRCWHAGITGAVNATNMQFQVTSLRPHLFMVSTLLRTRMSGYTIVVSCDLSGQVYYHDVRYADEDTTQVIVQCPLPFKNAIACTSDGNIIYCPSTDGALECYRITDGAHSIIKGALRGKGNLIKCSDNGAWIITGLYTDEFQIFYVEN